MIGWIQLREEELQSGFPRPTRLNLLPRRTSRWEREKETATSAVGAMLDDAENPERSDESKTILEISDTDKGTDPARLHKRRN